MQMALVQEKTEAPPVAGCGVCIYCFFGAPLNCHLNRGTEEPEVGLDQVIMNVRVDADQCIKAGEKFLVAVGLDGFVGSAGLGDEFKLACGRYVVGIGLETLMEQVALNVERLRLERKGECDREFKQAFGGDDTVELDAIG